MNFKPLVLSEAEALAKLDRSRVKQALRNAFSGLASGSTQQPAQTLTPFPGDEGDCIFYPGMIWDLNLVGVKVSPYISALKRAGKYPVTAFTMLMSTTTGLPVLLCDSYALTTARTAATTALALEYLTPTAATSLALIGSGKVALEHLRYVSEQHRWNDIRVWSPSLTADAAKARALGDALSAEGISVKVSRSAQDAVSGCDVVMLCTSSATPVVEASWLAPNAVVTSISTNAPKAHEVDPGSLSQFQVFCDYRATAPITAGEMVLAIASGAWSADRIVADLPELSVGRSVRPESGRVFFRSTGLGIEDLAIASLLL
jgi:L-arginine dehydrogenase